jgi:hypothetical protein
VCEVFDARAVRFYGGQAEASAMPRGTHRDNSGAAIVVVKGSRSRADTSFSAMPRERKRGRSWE